MNRTALTLLHYSFVFFSAMNLSAYPDCSLPAHTNAQPFFAHMIPEQTYEGTPLERNLAREEDFKNECVQCGENHE